MANRCLNKVMLIGNLTRDPELRYTPSGTAVCSFGIATNRQWSTQDGEKKEDAQFHKLVAWKKLAELCSQLLAKGRRIYVEGRLQYREWTGNDGVKRQTTEIVIEDMIILDARGAVGSDLPDEIPVETDEIPVSDELGEQAPAEPAQEAKSKNSDDVDQVDSGADAEKPPEVNSDDIPF
ncbi:MAG: single-stranded DNA-binding protein [Patescibacteria group bacterium]